MAELRLEIDRLDQNLVELLSQRQRYIERAAEIKAYRHEIRDEARIEDVLEKVTAAAKRAGLSPEIARGVWRELMERSIALEMARYEALSASNNSG
ncbi:MAG: chorismate mutase [Rhizomicrobium sp.]|nr:chorismate mutase [Rhizomicrobium sp.]